MPHPPIPAVLCDAVVGTGDSLPTSDPMRVPRQTSHTKTCSATLPNSMYFMVKTAGSHVVLCSFSRFCQRSQVWCPNMWTASAGAYALPPRAVEEQTSWRWGLLMIVGWTSICDPDGQYIIQAKTNPSRFPVSGGLTNRKLTSGFAVPKAEDGSFYCNIWTFPKIEGGTPKSSILIGL